MYIEYYSSDQRFVEPELGPDCWLSATGGTYKPTWLVRTSDWELVPGSEAKNGYCALSYCWEQSGEIIKMEGDDEYNCTNNPGHRLVIKKPLVSSAPESLNNTENIENNSNESSISSDDDDESVDFDDNYNAMEPEYQHMPILKRARRKKRDRTTHMVNYDTIIQQICQDFQIDYIWYDKLCINQADKAEKLREIKQMHLIYSNARFTVALVPEVNITNPADFEKPDPYAKTKARKKVHDTVMSKSHWSKRSWTFEELVMSQRILIVGRNVHAWHQADTFNEKNKNDNGESILQPFADPLVQILDFKNRKLKSANQILKYAQFRTSAKEHDKIFALANVFHGVIPIDIDYDCDIQQVVHNFYRRVAEHDLSVMCFGTVRSKEGGVRFKSMMSSYSLPSWTGVRGLHTHGAVHITQLPTSDSTRFNHFIDDEMRLHIKCKYISIKPMKHDGSHPDACVLKGSPFLFNNHDPESGVFIEHSTTPIEDDKKREKSSNIKADPTSMLGSSGCGATHYWKPPPLPGDITTLCTDDEETTSTAFQLSLTSQYCNECVILPILFDSRRACFVEKPDGTGWKTEYRHSYFLPVLSKRANSSTYIAIGIVLFKLYTHTQIPEAPLSVLEEAFGGSEEFDFVIE